MKIKEFFKRWKTGLKNLTPKQLIHSQLVGYGGATIGLSIALTGLIYRTVTDFNLIQLGFSIFVAFLVWMQVISYISTRQKYDAVKKMEESIELQKVIKTLEG